MSELYAKQRICEARVKCMISAVCTSTVRSGHFWTVRRKRLQEKKVCKAGNAIHFCNAKHKNI